MQIPAKASELERVARKLGFEKVRQERLSCLLATSRWTSNHNSYAFYEILKQLGITKEQHSRNKVQEIEGALIPLADTYSHLNPFLGAILAGVFTQGALDQLESKGFKILYLKYENIVKSFTCE